jgi:hypothetical protein
MTALNHSESDRRPARSSARPGASVATGTEMARRLRELVVALDRRAPRPDDAAGRPSLQCGVPASASGQPSDQRH